MIAAFITICVLSCFLLPFTDGKKKAWFVISAILINSIISMSFVWSAMGGNHVELIFKGSVITGPIALRADALSAWFMIIINVIFFMGSVYGAFYMNAYASEKQNLNLHAITFVLLHASLIALCVIQNSLLFLTTWEIMSLTAFICVIFEHRKVNTIKAGINYLIQSHIAIVFLMLGFIWVAVKTGSYDFSAITAFSNNQTVGITLALFISFFIGFSIKAGFIPFHTWLPYAHPAAPSHISGIMSGVIIKIGIFGILRMLLLIKSDYTTVGYIILAFAVFSGLYGVMLAIVQHNLKKLLAYHSIENIGIIGIGIGIGCLGIGKDNHTLTFLGFAGALLHVWNHALFKSLLFFTAGNVYQAYHTLDIERLGGVVKKMPQTSLLFLIAALAICGLPPFNGFISEFLIYSGFYNWLQDSGPSTLILVVFSILSLVLIGGLAILCFTKAFSIVFLGTNRYSNPETIKEAPFLQLLPLYFIAFAIVTIGVFPDMFLKFIYHPVSLFSRKVITEHPAIPTHLMETLKHINISVLLFFALTVAVLIIKKAFSRVSTNTNLSTWGCGYRTTTPKQQYTASSFVRSYSKLFRFIILIFQKEKNITGVFPGKSFYESQSYDRIEKSWIDTPVRWFKSFMFRFLFLQNGRLQVYILYGILFIILTITVPVVYHNFQAIIEFFKKL